MAGGHSGAIAVMPLLLTLLTACYLPVGTPVKPDEKAVERIHARLEKMLGGLRRLLERLWALLRRGVRWLLDKPFISRHKKLLAVVSAVVVVGALVATSATGFGVHDPIVIGHRGSAYGVENTLEAIQGAIDAGADYAEVDVMLSEDGVPMVVHDVNLNRLAGENVNVYDQTAAELQALTLRQNGYTGQIPTLQEVVDYCEGKIRLAVEFKPHGYETADTLEVSMAILSQSKTQKDSIYVSLDYGLVSDMKQRYPAWRTGYCVYGNVGQLSAGSLRDMNVDFLLIEEWMVAKPLLKAARGAWLPVYVWTVNHPDNMGTYLKMGVTGLVTDYPDTAMEILGTMYNLADREIDVEE